VLEFEEGRSRRSDPSIEAFNQNVAEAQRLEKEISDAEAQTEQQCESLRTEQVLRAFHACKLVTTDDVPPVVVEDFILSAGIKWHGNNKIPCSRLMRAIVWEGDAKGTVRFERKKQRATTYASAVDYAIRHGMSEEDFEAELRHPPAPGERHGLEHLAECGRKLRRGEVEDSCDPPADMPLRVEGDLSGTPPGDHLVVVRVVQGETVKGALLRVPESMVRRALVANNKSRQPNDQG
jgi:hypothetical protein